jgi:hypothetical protein
MYRKKVEMVLKVMYILLLHLTSDLLKLVSSSVEHTKIRIGKKEKGKRRKSLECGPSYS